MLKFRTSYQITSVQKKEEEDILLMPIKTLTIYDYITPS